MTENELRYVESYINDSFKMRVGTLSIMFDTVRAFGEKHDPDFYDKLSDLVEKCHALMLEKCDMKVEFLGALLLSCLVFVPEALKIIDEEAMLEEAKNCLEG